MLIIWNLFLLIFYFYYLKQIGDIEKGYLKDVVLIVLCFSIIIITALFQIDFAAWLMISFILCLYDLFYDKEPFFIQWYKVLILGIFIFFISFLHHINVIPSYAVITELTFLFSFFMLLATRKDVYKFSGIIVDAIYLIIIALSLTLKEPLIANILCLLSFLIFIMLEITLNTYKKGFEKSTRFFEQSLLQHQYEEIKNIYLDMRGWRHDYHNHLQAIKAHIALNQISEVNDYLKALEADLDKVDTYIKSGNLMVDAILNSKISLGEKREIKVTCKAQVPENINITEVDLCVILGNLLDNAIEACEEIPKEKRFLRIYIMVLKNQLYISIQNSSKDLLNFNERNYISSKRGNHGLGMKRVKLLVDKYEGFLNLQNEAGIFASEITLPLI